MEQPQLKADYVEKIAIQPEDIIPKSTWLKCLKIFLITILTILIIIALIAIIVAESFLERTYLTVGIISLLGIILFLIGLMAIVKEHVPSILIFAVSMIFYLLLLMYSRIFDTAGWIIIRTVILACIIILTVIYCILIRDWQQLQVSRLRQRAIKEVQQQYGVSTPLATRTSIYHGGNNPRYLNHPPQFHSPHLMPPSNMINQSHHHQYEQIDNIYSQIGPPSSHQHQLRQQSPRMNRQTPSVVLTKHYN